MAENKCVCCGAIIPEGRQVCVNCEKAQDKNCINCANSIFDEIWGEYKCKVHNMRIYYPTKRRCEDFKIKK